MEKINGLNDLRSTVAENILHQRYEEILELYKNPEFRKSVLASAERICYQAHFHTQGLQDYVECGEIKDKFLEKLGEEINNENSLEVFAMNLAELESFPDSYIASKYEGLHMSMKLSYNLKEKTIEKTGEVTTKKVSKLRKDRSDELTDVFTSKVKWSIRKNKTMEKLLDKEVRYDIIRKEFPTRDEYLRYRTNQLKVAEDYFKIVKEAFIETNTLEEIDSEVVLDMFSKELIGAINPLAKLFYKIESHKIYPMEIQNANR
jgi:hypothetical protein